MKKETLIAGLDEQMRKALEAAARQTRCTETGEPLAAPAERKSFREVFRTSFGGSKPQEPSRDTESLTLAP